MTWAIQSQRSQAHTSALDTTNNQSRNYNTSPTITSGYKEDAEEQVRANEHKNQRINKKEKKSLAAEKAKTQDHE